MNTSPLKNGGSITKLGSIYLDDLNNLKILHPNTQTHVENYEKTISEYSNKSKELSETMTNYIKNNQAKADKVEETRLKSVGLNLQIEKFDLDREREVILKNQRKIELMQELGRLEGELKSLQKVEEQIHKSIEMVHMG